MVTRARATRVLDEDVVTLDVKEGVLKSMLAPILRFGNEPDERTSAKSAVPFFLL